MFDDFFGLLILVLVVIFFTPLILSIVAMSRTGDLRRRLMLLETKLAQYQTDGVQPQPAAAEAAALEPLAQTQPRWSAAYFELGLARGEAGDGEGAIRALSHAVSLKPDLAEAWGALADQRRLQGDARGADSARARQLACAARDPMLLEAGAALVEGKLAVAEHLLRDVLRARPDEIAALRMLAEVATRLGRYEDAEHHLGAGLGPSGSLVDGGGDLVERRGGLFQAGGLLFGAA